MKPRRFSSFDMVSESGVLAGIGPAFWIGLPPVSAFQAFVFGIPPASFASAKISDVIALYSSTEGCITKFIFRR